MVLPIFTVYLLHFDQPVGRYLHYVGIAKSHRLHWRMLDHINGRGSALTAKAVELGIGFEITAIWRSSDPAKEQEIKRAGNFKNHCWKCMSPPTPAKLDLPKTHYECKPVASSYQPIDGLTGSRFSRYQP